MPSSGRTRPAPGLLLLLLLSLAAAPGRPAAAQPAFSSNLPIVVIDTEGREIQNEPKVEARMGVIDNGEGARNTLGDPFNGYDGLVGVEYRGSSTQMFPKKSFAVETRDAEGRDLDVALLGLPEESDWILYAPYTDKSLLRNVLAYDVARRMGRYATRTRFCEVVLNGQYWGVYVLMEKIKRDAHRVDIAKLDPHETTGDDLTGGYIIKIDKTDGAEVGGWVSAYVPRANPAARIFYQYHEPDPTEIVPEQEAYIQGVVRAFEDVMAGDRFADPADGYPRYLDVPSAVDYFLLNELGRNVDGYRLSAFLYKDKDSKGGKFVLGPAWDFNLAFGNADYYGGSNTAGFQVGFAEPSDGFQIPFWWPRLLRDPAFTEAARARWDELRRGPLHLDSLDAFLDANVALLAEAAPRNFERWPVLGQYVWPNNFVGQTYAQEVAYLKQWLWTRVNWLDGNIGVGDAPPLPAAGNSLSSPYPNPFRTEAVFDLSLSRPQHVRVAVYDLLGREVALLHDGYVPEAGVHRFTIDALGLPAGVYVYRVAAASFTESRRVLLVR